jgi:hypothetical protein
VTGRNGGGADSGWGDWDAGTTGTTGTTGTDYHRAVGRTWATVGLASRCLLTTLALLTLATLGTGAFVSLVGALD